MAQDIIKITDAAAQRVKSLLEQRTKPTVGIKIGVRSGGCTGMAYTFEYAENFDKFDEIIDDKGVKIIVDVKAVMFLVGTTLDYVDEITRSGFVFINPNEKSRCGCEESFAV